MSTTRNIIFPLIAALALMLAGCRHDSATMHELALIDSMIYHQSEREALPLLQQMNTEQFSKGERAYYDVLLSMAMYKNYVPCTSDSAINEAVDYYKHSGNDLPTQN